MPRRPVDPLLSPRSPVRVLALVLLLVFGAEATIMLCFPWLPSAWRGAWLDSLLDAGTLTAVMTPAVWYLVALPLRRLFDARGQLLGRAFDAQERERARVARDLHDGIGQHLTALLIGLRRIEDTKSIVDVGERARELREVASLAHGEVRRIARGLRPALLEELGLIPALERLCDDFRRAHDLATVFRCDAPTGERFAAEVETALYRIAQEALSNAARHAAARSVEVALASGARGVTLSIRDDGRGFEAESAAADDRADGGLGLAGIRERVSMLGGQMDVKTGAGLGTAIEVCVPRRE